MKLKKLSLCLIILFIVPNVESRTEYWPTIKALMLKCDETKGHERNKAVEAYNKYLSSLGAAHLIEAGRKCSQEAESSNPGTVFSKETWYLSRFFYNQYPKAGGLKDIGMLLKEIEDKTQPNFWRINLVNYFDGQKWTQSLTDEQMHVIIDKALLLFADKTEHFALRYEACQTILHLLDDLEIRLLLAEPIIQAKMQNGTEVRKLKEEVAAGLLKLSDNYQKNMAGIFKLYNDYSQRLLSAMKEPMLNPALQSVVLSGMRESSKKTTPIAPKVHKILAKSARNYNRFDKSCWKLLVNIAHNNLSLPDSIQIAEKMMSDLQKDFEFEKDKKKKTLIQEDIKVFERMIKKYKDNKSNP
jgi:hypothetical protein